MVENCLIWPKKLFSGLFSPQNEPPTRHLHGLWQIWLNLDVPLNHPKTRKQIYAEDKKKRRPIDVANKKKWKNLDKKQQIIDLLNEMEAKIPV